MKVGELINELQEWPLDSDVYFKGKDRTYIIDGVYQYFSDDVMLESDWLPFEI